MRQFWNVLRFRQAIPDRPWVAAAALAAIVYAVLASLTHPFTLSADVVTGATEAVGLVVLVWRSRSAGRFAGRPGAPAPADPAADTTTETPLPAVDTAGRPARWGRRWLAWVTLAVVAGAWELYCYVSAPRVEHPTFSVLLDAADATRPGKTVVFALWLALGWFLVAR